MRDDLNTVFELMSKGMSGDAFSDAMKQRHQQHTQTIRPAALADFKRELHLAI